MNDNTKKARELLSCLFCGSGLSAGSAGNQRAALEPVGKVHSGRYASGMPWCEVEWYKQPEAGTEIYAAPQPASAVPVAMIAANLNSIIDLTSACAAGDAVAAANIRHEATHALAMLAAAKENN